jgi:hypothetical protein
MQYTISANQTRCQSCITRTCSTDSRDYMAHSRASVEVASQRCGNQVNIIFEELIISVFGVVVNSESSCENFKAQEIF